jgi:hypothetical protein
MADVIRKTAWVWLGIAAATASGGAMDAKAPFPVTVDLDKGRAVDSSPSLGDINGDGRDEIVVGCKDGKVHALDGQGRELWSYATGDTIESSPAIGDINGDKRAEVIIGSTDGSVYALSGGTLLPGWPVSTGGAVRSTPAIADLDGDLKDDVIVGSSDGKVYAYRGSGTDIIGWPVVVGGGVDSSPAVADVDGDGLAEVAVGADDGNVYLIDNDGKLVPGWPVETRYYVRSSPAIGDIDNDGSLEVVVGSDDFNVYAWKANGAPVPGWPVTTEYKLSIASPALADLDGDKKLDVIIGSGDNILYAWEGGGAPLSGFPVQTNGRLYNSSPCVADINGDGSLDIIVGGEDTNLYIFDARGRADADSPVALSGPCHSSPAVGDIDGDGLLELVVADGAGNLFAFDCKGSATLGRGSRWNEFHQSHWKAGVYGYVGGASQLPKCVVPKMEGEYGGDVTVTYALSDPQLSTLDLKVMYSDDWGHTWHDASVSGMTASLGPNRYQGSVTWDSAADLKGPLEKGGERGDDVLADEWREYREQKDVKVKIIPSNPNGLGTAGETTLLHIDNNKPPVVTVKPLTEEVSKDIYVDYDIADPEHDLIALQGQYSTDGGKTWKEATLDGATTDIRSSRYKGNITWVSDKDLKGVDQKDIIFRLTPKDNDAGEAGTVADVHVDNNQLPAVAVNEIEEEVAGDVPVSYELSDEESDALALVSEFSLDSGQTWKPATVSGTASGIGLGAYAGAITWKSRTDTLGVDKTSVQFRITPQDNDPGKADATSSFHLDNNDTPTVAITPLETEQTGRVQIIYTIADPEGDAVTVVPEVYDEAEAKWKIATASGALTDVEPSGYNGSFIWDSDVDMLGIDNARTKFRLTPYDNDQGNATEAKPFHVDDNSPPTVLVNDVTVPQRGDVTITYTLSDLERDTLSFKAEYSEDGGATWKPATVEGTAAGIGVDSYFGQITWHSGADTMHKYLTQARFRLVPADNDAGNPGSTSDFIVDNNIPPRIQVLPPSPEQAGDVNVGYRLDDDEGNAVTLRVDYSTDGGQTWTPATVTGTTEGIGPGGYNGALTWNSAADVPGLDQDNLLVRITPADVDVGEPVVSAPIHVDNDKTPSVIVNTPAGEVGGDITVEYTLADPENDVLSIKPEYSEDGGATWEPATVDGVLTDIYSSGYLGSVVWRSDRDLGGTDQTDIAFRVTPADNDVGTAGRTENFHLDNNQIPTIRVETPAGVQSGNVQITYKLEDPESDASAIKCEYSTDDGFTWNEATVATTTRIDPTKYSGTVIWDSKADLPALDREDVRFRVTPYDNDEGISDVTDAFHLNNNIAPKISAPPITAKSSGDVEVPFEVSDVEGDDVNLKIEYSTDKGSTWSEGTVGGALEGIRPDAYKSDVMWNSFADLPGVDNNDVWLRISPADNNPGEPTIIKGLHVDNDDPPQVTVTDIYEEQKGDVTIEYSITDAEGDAASLAFEYSVDGGATWKKPTLGTTVANVSPSGYSGTVVWHSAQDIKGLDSDQVMLRATPSDNDVGPAYTTTAFQVDDNEPPAVAVTPPGDVGRDQVPVSYRVTDAENDAVNLVCEYSLDGGVTWDPATVAGATENVGPAGYSGTLTWNAREDVGGTDSSQLLFRVTPVDRDEGTAVATRPFRVDVNNPPTVAIRELTDKQGDEVPIDYELSDEEGDILAVKAEYSSDNGASWRPATVDGPTSDISSITYANSLTWNARKDLGALDSDKVAFRITPSDADAGTLAQLQNIHVDTNRPPAVEVTAAPSADGTGDVKVTYAVRDEESDTVEVMVEYSADGGFTFSPAAVTPAPTRLGPAQYRGTFSWLATQDGKGLDLTDAVLRLTAKDNDPGEPASTSPFHVDNNHVPSVTVRVPAGAALGDEVEVAYTLADDEGDRLSLVPEYSLDGGVSWRTATTFGMTSDVGPNAYEGTLLWSAVTDAPGQEIKNAAFRITPYDSQAGKPGVASGLFVDTNRPPQAGLGDVFAEQEESPVKLDYTIMDNEGDAVSLKCEYSLDGGTSWRPATMLSPTANIAAASYFGTMSWDAARDVGEGKEADVVFRITPSDANAGEPVQNRPFRVDLNEPPSASLLAYKEETDGTVKVDYSVRDEESNAVRLDIRYSEDGGASWLPATVNEDLSNLGAGAYKGTFTWQRLRDVPTVLPGSRVMLRAIPADEDEGKAGDITLDLKPTGE